MTASTSLTILGASAAWSDTASFDSDTAGGPPKGWICGVTGQGAPKWLVEADTAAPSRPNVLKQSGSGVFPWCVVQGSTIADGFVEVKLKPIAGKQDQAGGVVWRFKDGDSYYVARANALENNVSLYYTERGRRNTLQYVDAPVARDTWHTLRVEFRGTRIKVMLNGETYIERDDGHIAAPGSVGLWTKADSVTAFDDFVFGGTAGR
jgi:hypothetical protein